MKCFSTWLFLTIACLLSGSLYAQSTKRQTTTNIAKNSPAMAKNENDPLWKKVDSLSDQGLPQSAIKIVNSILQQAESAKNETQYIKANLYELKLRAQFEENYLANYINEREKLLADAPRKGNSILNNTEVKSIIHSILADLYWMYYLQNRHVILDRGVLSVADNPRDIDITKWDIRQFIEVVLNNHKESLRNKQTLQQTDLKKYDAILELAKDSKKFRPTLYDFLAHRAIDFLINEEASIIKPVDLFIIDNPNYLSPAAEFTKLNVYSKDDTLSFNYQALLLFQENIAFHLNDLNPDALIDVDLKRLEYIHGKLNHSSADSLYNHALLNLEKKYSGNTASAPIMLKLAEWYYSDPQPPVRIQHGTFPAFSNVRKADLVKAREWCLKLIESFPDSPEAISCKHMLKRIEEPHIEFMADKTAIPDKEFPILVNYKNVKQIWFRLIETEYNSSRELYGNQQNNLKDYISAKPYKKWNVIVPDSGDYKIHSTEIIMPAIKTGYYILMLSDKENISSTDTIVSYSPIQISNISYISRNSPDGSGVVYVLNRTNGDALANVEVQSFVLSYDYRKREYNRQNKEKYITKSDGSFIINAPGPNNNANLSFEFRYKGDKLISDNYYALYDRSRFADHSPKTTTYFYTDRAIYRPGQPVYFKGIVVNVNENKALASFSSKVNFYDVNSQIISSAAVTTNEFGSFSGSFIIPASGLTGTMRIGNEWGSTQFNVEEYKRPRFEVIFNPIDSSFKINQEVTVSGNAKTYSGVALSNANVKYRVVRTQMRPFFWSFRSIWPPYNIPDAEIANGVMETLADGSFSITFTALPDPSEFNIANPYYTYQIYADVTDINGETQTAQTSVNVSNTALMLNADVSDEINAALFDSIKIQSTNLSGRPTSARVKVEIHKLADVPVLRPREWEVPDVTIYSRDEFKKRLPQYPYHNEEYSADKSSTQNNPVKQSLIFTSEINTSVDSVLNFKNTTFEPGSYLITLSSIDKYGTPVKTEKQVILYNPNSKKLPINQHLFFTTLTPEAQKGDVISFLAGSAVEGKMLLELSQESKIIMHKWYELKGQEKIDVKLPDDVSGKINVLATLIYNNYNYKVIDNLDVTDKSKQLTLTFETFRTPLLPGGKEKWKIKITDSQGKPVNAELLTSMYDASLDAFIKHNWNFTISKPWQQSYNWELMQSFLFGASLSVPKEYYGDPIPRQDYDKLNWFGFYNFNYLPRFDGVMSMGVRSKTSSMLSVVEDEILESIQAPADLDNSAASGAPAEKTTVQVRRNLNETAFFYPQITTNKEGELWIEFVVPEALTKWNFMGIAHTPDLLSSKFTKEVVTQKELMVTPNLPRFMRQGDKMFLSTKINNLMANPIQGSAKLELFDALSMQPIDDKFNNIAPVISFSVNAGSDTSVGWEIVVPEISGAIILRITATAGNHSDGEEVILPVLTNRIMITETMPLPLSGRETKTFNFKRLTDQASTMQGSTSTLRNYRLTLEYTSNPAWYAVQALPWLSANEKENADQLFNRFYANKIAGYILNSNPKIKSVFEIWKNSSPEAFLSNLQKNQELKSMLIEETPWLAEARNEREQQQRLALLFDFNRLSSDELTSLRKLKQTQTASGAWAWFEGMPESRYITQLIVTGLGKLHYLNINDLSKDNETNELVQKAVNYLSLRIIEDYNRIKKESEHKNPKSNNKKIEGDNLSYEHIQFLYALSYLKNSVTIDPKAKEAIAYFGNQARTYWNTRSLLAQSMIAIWAGRNGDNNTTQSIIASLREKSINNEEMGTYWRDNRGGYFWYQAPIETQAVLIELFEEFANRSNSPSGNDKTEVDKMKLWLLKQKQTQSWPTTTATTEAIYALLLRGSDWLTTESAFHIKVGDKVIDSKNMSDIAPLAGTGYFKTSWSGDEIKPQMGGITISKENEGPSWGAVYLQYFENQDKVTAAESPLKINKKIFISRNTNEGVRLEPINAGNTLKIGDKVTVRIEISTDRDLEYVHLKDMRASSFEPVTVISGYNWKGGLGYYVSTRDASTNFFFNYLVKGSHTFEYDLVVTQAGEYSNGLGTIQCMYAPEFAAHTEGIRVLVEK